MERINGRWGKIIWAAFPVRNFSEGRIVEDDETMAMGGQYIREQQLERGGQTAHACMPGCTIECSNVYVDKDGNEVTPLLNRNTG
ncbi:MAG: hypothetical protein CM1200mP18_12490 [Gammaproteobacteria bacterium]|nr:MAG: hypothetical protein CM1200mP18_12490 [Gammaproteobacteria bacterium]